MGFHSTSSSNCAVELVSHSAFSARCIQKLCYLRQLLQCFNCVRKLDKGTADPLVLYCTYTRTQELQITSDSLTLFLIYIKGVHPGTVCFSLWYFDFAFAMSWHVFNSVDSVASRLVTRPPEQFGAACLSPCESCASFQQHIVEYCMYKYISYHKLHNIANYNVYYSHILSYNIYIYIL